MRRRFIELLFEQMSLVSEFNNLALLLGWIPYKEIIDIEPTQIDNVYYARRQTSGEVDEIPIMLLFLGNSEECTVREFARIYSLPTHKYRNDVNEFRRYPKWLSSRNNLIKGFTKSKNNYYMV